MKIYSKLVWDKDFNIIEELSSEYTGPVARMMCISPPPPPPPPTPPPPSPAPSPSPTGSSRRGSGRRLTAAGRGRGVLIRSRSPLGITDPNELGARKNLLQPTLKAAQNVMRLLGGGY